MTVGRLCPTRGVRSLVDDDGRSVVTERFDVVPPIGRGGAHFVGGTAFTAKGLLRGGLTLARLMWRMQRSPGFLYRRFWYRYPLTFGSLAYFEDLDAIRSFTRTPEHRAIQRFAKRPGNVRGGFVRVYRTEPFGITMGEWISTIDRSSGEAASGAPATNGGVICG